MPNDIYNSLSFKHCRDWDREAAKTGYHSYKIDGNWDWNVVREEMTGHSLPSSTLGLTNFGNSNGCKQSLDQNYIPMAEATGNVTVHHNHEVKEISRNGDLYELDIVEYDPYGEIIHQKTVTCDKLIMAAGAYHTPRMLVRAKAKGTLPELNEFVGKNWGDNGNRMAFRQSLFGLPQGGPQASPSPSAIYVPDCCRELGQCCHRRRWRFHVVSRHCGFQQSWILLLRWRKRRRCFALPEGTRSGCNQLNAKSEHQYGQKKLAAAGRAGI